MVMAMDGSTQSLCPATMTMTGRTKAATSSMTVGGRNGPLDAFGFGAGGPVAGPGGDPDTVGQDGNGDDQAGCGQDGPGPAADVEGAADQPEGGKGQLDETSDAPDPV